MAMPIMLVLIVALLNSNVEAVIRLPAAFLAKKNSSRRQTQNPRYSD